ncbi:DUF4040 family protein [Micrococcus luteus]|uniref:DUF4040 family protein n=1 Tax=Micrococcus luteus TaxID=1270 RepID=UPI0011AB4E1E|nr:DUF4040 family protein [Micrococcus luteus]MCT1810838.1 DUF4040 family protein [Micrococcus luteus]MCV7664751.1 DUF4040 family protein [Micrococcus luteus]
MLLTSLLLTLLSVVAAVPASRVLGRDAGWVLAAPLLAAAGVLIAAWTGDVRTEHHPWIPAVGVDLDLRLNGLALVFAMIVLVIGAAILAYSSRYLSRDRTESRPGSFYLLMTAFAASMLLLVLADNIVVLFVAWEFTSFTSFFLIGRSGDHARDPAIRTLLVTVGGGLALLAAVALMAVRTGTASLSGVLASDVWSEAGFTTTVAVLLAVAAFTKSAQFPFQAWLPDSMVAISPVSAYLHAAAMVKAGIFLLLVFSPVLAGNPVWSALLIGSGLITALLGAVSAIRRHDLKGLLAYSTMSQLGLLVTAIGIGTPVALTAAIVHTVAHALFKSALFMLIGVVDHEAGTRDLRELAARHVRMPVTGTAIAVAALSMAGIPPLFGFISKEGLVEAALGTPGPAWLPVLVTAGIALTSVFTVAYSGRLVLGALGLWGPSPDGAAHSWPTGREDEVHEAPATFWGVPVLAAAAGVALGLLPGVLDTPVSYAAEAASGAEMHAHLALWHGVNTALLVSAAIIVLGLLLVALRRPVERVASHAALPFSALDAVDEVRHRLIGVGAVVSRASGTLAPRPHLLIPALVLGLLAVAGVATIEDLPAVVGQPSRWHDWVLVVLVGAGVIATIRAKTRIAAMVVVGVVGFGMTLWFLTLGAVDVALTQLMVEVLTVCVMVLLLRRLPARFSDEPTPRRMQAVLAASVAGVAATLGVLAFTGRSSMSEIAHFYLTQSYAQAGGTNVVNVILVDFRAVDTWGEMTVLGATALTIAALLLNRRPTPPQPSAVDMRSPLAHVRENLVHIRVFGRVFGVLIILLSAFLLLRGHYEPGGGFIAALVAGAGYALLYLAADSDTAPELRWPYLAFIGSGIAVGTATGIVGYLTGKGFLGAAGVKVLDYGLSTTLAFDMGVYLAVIGLIVAAFSLLGPERPGEDPLRASSRDPGVAPAAPSSDPSAPTTTTAREEVTR